MTSKNAVLSFPDIEVGSVREYADRTGLPEKFVRACVGAGRLDGALVHGRRPIRLRFARANAIIDCYPHMTRRPSNGRS